MNTVALDDDVIRFMEAQSTQTVAECGECGAQMGTRQETCIVCGWINPLKDLGLI